MTKWKEQNENQRGGGWVYVRQLPLGHCWDGGLRMTDMESDEHFEVSYDFVWFIC